VHLVGFIIRICHGAWSPERQIKEYLLVSFTLRRESIYLENLDALTAGTLPNS